MPIIHSVKQDGEYFIINEALKVRYMIEDEFEESNMDIEFDDSVITEQEAIELATFLLQESIRNFDTSKGLSSN